MHSINNMGKFSTPHPPFHKSGTWVREEGGGVKIAKFIGGSFVNQKKDFTQGHPISLTGVCYVNGMWRLRLCLI